MKLKVIDLVIKKGFSQKEAEILIRTGKVKTNIEKILLPSQKIDHKAEIFILENKKYVSRGAEKLKQALDFFEVKVDNLICLDIGSSTGGFTQILLENNAKLVFALDSGLNQLNYKLRNDNRVISMEKTNIKFVKKEDFSSQIDFAVCDVSFISLTKVFPVVKNLLYKNSLFLVLLKPQFEASSKYVEKGGFVNKKFHLFLIEKIKKNASENNFIFIKSCLSPITGKVAKNEEYFLLFKKIN